VITPFSLTDHQLTLATDSDADRAIKAAKSGRLQGLAA
jgi:hypothetical protein